MKWLVALASIAAVQGCAADSNDPAEPSETAEARAERKCREFIQGLCSQYVRCHAESSSGGPITDAVCDAALPDAVADCVRSSSDDIAETSDANFDACATALRDEACELVCGRVPEDPEACLSLGGYEPQTLVVTCTL